VSRAHVLGAALLAASALAAGAAAPDPASLWVVGWGQPNTAGHVRGILRAYRHVEVDLLLDARGRLVGAHDAEKLARIERGRVADPLTLPELLAMPAERVFLDMKDTLPVAEAPPADSAARRGLEARALRALDAAADAIAAAGRGDEVFVMTYWLSETLAERARERDVRLMAQGYPRSEEDALGLVREAAALGLDHACIPLRRVTARVLDESQRLGVHHVPYTFFEEGWTEAEYRARLAPLRGLILPPVAGPRLARLLAGD